MATRQKGGSRMGHDLKAKTKDVARECVVEAHTRWLIHIAWDLQLRVRSY